MRECGWLNVLWQHFRDELWVLSMLKINLRRHEKSLWYIVCNIHMEQRVDLQTVQLLRILLWSVCSHLRPFLLLPSALHKDCRQLFRHCILCRTFHFLLRHRSLQRNWSKDSKLLSETRGQVDGVFLIFIDQRLVPAYLSNIWNKF